MSILLEINNLHASVEGKEILKGVNLSVPEGEVHALMGPNGAGKSTLAAVLTGRPGYTVTGGSVTFMGKDLLAMEPEERAWAGIFMSFQYPIEIPGVTMNAFMKAAIDASRASRGLAPLSGGEFLKLLREKMALVGMNPDFAKREVNVGFSGGEKKRTEILQLLMLNPKLALPDETDSGLDVDAVQIVSEGVAKFHNSENSCLIITHNTRILEHLKVDKVHVLMNGQIVEEGGPELIEDINSRGFAHIREEQEG